MASVTIHVAPGYIDRVLLRFLRKGTPTTLGRTWTLACGWIFPVGKAVGNEHHRNKLANERASTARFIEERHVELGDYPQQVGSDLRWSLIWEPPG